MEPIKSLLNLEDPPMELPWSELWNDLRAYNIMAAYKNRESLKNAETLFLYSDLQARLLRVRVAIERQISKEGIGEWSQ